jgi:hypothetical protein
LEVTDPKALAAIGTLAGETVVEIPDRMLQFFGREGLDTGIR